MVALHWLKGLLRTASGAADDAMASFDQELALEARGHLYAREAAANTWCLSSRSLACGMPATCHRRKSSRSAGPFAS